MANNNVKLIGSKEVKEKYYLKKDIKLDDVKIQKDEVAFVKYMNELEIKELISDNI